MKKILKFIFKTLVLLFSLLVILFALNEIEMEYAQKENIYAKKPITYPMGNSDLSIFLNGKKLNKQLFDDIRNAKKEVHIYFFSVSNDRVSHEFLDILKKKSDEGIPVYYAVDRLGGILLERKERKSLIDHGVHFTYFNKPKLSYFFASINNRNHRRMTIIDGEIGYIGGFNIGKKYIDEKKGLIPWEDVQLRLVGSGVEGLEKQFVHDWRKNSDQKITQMEISKKVGKSQHQFVSYTKIGIDKEYSKLFKQAKHSITIYSPYFIPNNKLIWNTLKDSANNGIDVKILYSHKSDALLVEQAAIPYIKQAWKNNIKVYGYKKGIFHGKVIKIDDKVLMIGTVNFDSRSFHLTDELDCYIYDQQFINQVEPKLANVFNHAFEITPAYLKSLPFKDRIKEKIAKVFEFYL
ncbi:phosphatidylserine/phosphatidylglycerophosphate/cardiolipin synthase family protein [Bacillus sp. AFS041924]|uniref:phospholipase D-like domain-containing protein n=1 Tax=Bacillus sp. AFS041924 TaxID=2033503 RepID=UPI000BFE502E|nr:phospholipase D-like domain-containing protein [Bacillus sp. AFS041924]PGS53398.1 cardiolipin synthase [Bacillus sp. AFS041924]